MTLRDYLATQAMREILAWNNGMNPMDVATMSYCVADSMLDVAINTEEGTPVSDAVPAFYSGYEPIVPGMESGQEEHTGHTVGRD